MGGFYDFRDPIEYVVNQYFERKRNANNNNSDNQASGESEQSHATKEVLPEYPFKILKNRNGKAYKFIYGDFKVLETEPEANVIVWQEELLYDENDKFLGVTTTHPDGTELTVYKMEEDGQCSGFEVS